MSATIMIAMTYFPTLTNAQGQRKPTTWAALCRWLSSPVISLDKHDVGGFSIATYAGDRRSLANVEQVFALGLDLDEAVDLTELRQRFEGTDAFVHTTHSSTIQEPRCRVFLRLSRGVDATEYRRIYSAVTGVVESGGVIVDRAASDPSRFWFRPSIAEEGRSFIYWTCTGKPIDVDNVLASIPPPPPPAPSGPRLVTSGVDVYDRAKAYLDKCEGAISGSGGHARTFTIACKLVRGFALSSDDAYRLLCDWNSRCSPPWSEWELKRKITQAAEHGRMAEGGLADRERSR